jgi:hypothetical protein
MRSDCEQRSKHGLPQRHLAVLFGRGVGELCSGGQQREQRSWFCSCSRVVHSRPSPSPSPSIDMI